MIRYGGMSPREGGSYQPTHRIGREEHGNQRRSTTYWTPRSNRASSLRFASPNTNFPAGKGDYVSDSLTCTETTDQPTDEQLPNNSFGKAYQDVSSCRRK